MDERILAVYKGREEKGEGIKGRKMTKKGNGKRGENNGQEWRTRGEVVESVVRPWWFSEA